MTEHSNRKMFFTLSLLGRPPVDRSIYGRICLVKPNLWLVSFLLILAVAVPSSAASLKRHWSLSQGANVAEFGADGLHLNQRAASDTTSYATAAADLNLAHAPIWRVAFNVRFGTLRSAGAAVRLCSGATIIGWIGADGWFKGIGAFIGDTSKFGKPADARWHQVVYAADGQTLTIWVDGLQVAEGASTATPDAIQVGSWWDGKGPAGQQTEVWIRGVQEQSVTVPPPLPPTLITAAPTPTVTPPPDFRGVPLDRLVEDYDDTLGRAQEANKAFQNSCNVAGGYLDLMAKAITDEQIAEDQKDFDYCMGQENKSMADQKRELRLALAMRGAIGSSPGFIRLYHETHQCLPPEEVTLDMPEARRLRFIEKR
jgi:hypothetical protein